MSGALWQGLGKSLEALAATAQASAVIAAPFIKRNALSMVLARLARHVPLLCVTRWRPEELAIGVTDLDIYLDLLERGNARVLLVNNLHAKYFRFDHRVAIGSCNLTGAALGYGHRSNLELLLPIAADEGAFQFEAHMLAAGVFACDEAYKAMSQAVLALATTAKADSASDKGEIEASDLEQLADHSIQPWAEWLPACRAPELLFDAYRGEKENLSAATRIAAASDLDGLHVPQGLTRAQFETYVASMLLSSPVVAKLANFARTPRRFGEMRGYLRMLVEVPHATHDWQTVMRWLLYFSPNRFEMRVANYSEIFFAKW